VLQLREKEQQVYQTRGEEVSRAMQQIFKKQDVRFRSVERELAVQAVLDKQTPLIIVLLAPRDHHDVRVRRS
jgi:hypothetical protein